MNITRKIWTLKVDQTVSYLNADYAVIEVYPYIAYLKHKVTGEIVCASIGDLVIAGLEPSLPPSKETFREMLAAS